MKKLTSMLGTAISVIIISLFIFNTTLCDINPSSKDIDSSTVSHEYYLTHSQAKIGRIQLVGGEWRIHRTLLSFALSVPPHHYISNATLHLQISNSVNTTVFTKARVTDGSGIPPNASNMAIFDGIVIGEGIFTDLTYDDYSGPVPRNSEKLLSLVRSAYVAGDPLQLGVCSQVEDSSNSGADVLAYLAIETAPSEFLVTLDNSYGEGLIRFNQEYYSSGATFYYPPGDYFVQAFDHPVITSDGIAITYHFNTWWKNEVEYGGGSLDPQVTVDRDIRLKADFSGQATISSTHTVAFGSTLKFLPSTTVTCAPNSKIMVYGTFLAQGTLTKPVVFTCPSENWQGIEFSGASGSSLTNCQIRFATSPIVATNTSNLLLSCCTISNSNFGYDAALRFYNSSPQIVTCQINGQEDSWNGVRFASGSTGIISGSVIQNCGAGNGIVVQGGSSPTIQGNTIRNNYYDGIIIPNNGQGFPIIDGNDITNNGPDSYVAISFGGSQGQVKGTSVSFSAGGLYCSDYSYVQTSNAVSYYDQGFNTVRQTRLGLLASNYSTLFFGYVDFFPENCIYYYGACNRVSDNSLYHAVSCGGSVIQAEADWWGSYPPDDGKFVPYDGGTIDRLYPKDNEYVNCDPVFEGGPLRAAPGSIMTVESDDVLQRATRALFKQDFSSARTLYRSLAVDASSASNRKQGLAGLYKVHRFTKDASLLDDLWTAQNGGADVGIMATELLAYSNLNTRNLQTAKNLAGQIRIAHPKTDYAMRALMLLASLSSYDPSEKATSASAVEDLKKDYPDKVDGAFLAAVGSMPAAGRKSADSRESEEVLSSYPNPFNPTTNIRFNLTTRSRIVLKVYDILGREIVTLLDEERAPGTHTVAWDGSTFASGMYLVRLESLGRIFTEKLLLMK